MSGLTDRLRQGTKEYSVGGGEVAVLGMKAGQLGAMLDVIDAADSLLASDPDAEAVQEAWDDLEDMVVRFREVAQE